MNRAKKDSTVRFPEFQAAFLELMGDMTIKEFAEKLGMSRATVGFYSVGQRIPDASGVKTIAEKCGVSADWLLGLSNIRSNDGELKQICKYTGLNQRAIELLHLISEGAGYPNVTLLFLNEFLSDKIVFDFNKWAWRAAAADAGYEKRIKSDGFSGIDEFCHEILPEKLQTIKDEIENTVDSELLAQLKDCKKSEWTIKIAHEDVGALYSSRASSCLEEAFEEAVFTGMQLLIDKYLR